MIRNILLIGFGGFIGSVLRYYAQLYITKWLAQPFPYGTLAVNVAGSLIIGLIYGYSVKSGWVSAEWRLFLATGFCGGFTTFSTFSFETVDLLQQGQTWATLSYVMSSLALGILFCFLGLTLTK